MNKEADILKYMDSSSEEAPKFQKLTTESKTPVQSLPQVDQKSPNATISANLEIFREVNTLYEEDKIPLLTSLAGIQIQPEMVQEKYVDLPEDRQQSLKATLESSMQQLVVHFKGVKAMQDEASRDGLLRALQGDMVRIGVVMHYIVNKKAVDFGVETPPFNNIKERQGWDISKELVEKIKLIIESPYPTKVAKEIVNNYESTEPRELAINEKLIKDPDIFAGLIAEICRLKVEPHLKQ